MAGPPLMLSLLALALALAAETASTGGGAGAPPAKRWRQDRFVISFWVDPIVAPADFAPRYAEVWPRAHSGGPWFGALRCS
jgi:hypothetical protein